MPGGGGSVFTGPGGSVDAFIGSHPYRELTDPITAIEKALVAQTQGYGITGNTSTPPAPAVALTFASGHIAADVTMTNGSQSYKLFDTASLGVGTWLVNMTATFTGGGLGTIDMSATADSATAGLNGPTSTGIVIAALNYEGSMSVSLTAVISVAGTLQLIAEASGAGNVAKAVTSQFGFGNATGYTAVRIA